MLGTIREFWRDQRGVAMILVAIMLPVLIGFAILAIDMSRANGLHNDLQKGADAMALAAAAELDGRSDSITRADRALGLVANKYLFSSSSNAPADLKKAGITWSYLKSLPASDSDAISTTDVTTDPKSAAFVQVTVTPVGFNAIFPVSFLSSSASNSFNVGAVAVAGFEQSICETVPIFMCNPFETTDSTTSKTIQQAFASGDTYSREFRILKVDSNPGPGNFGLIDNNLVSLRDAIAMGTAGTCYNRDALTTKTGVTLGQVNSGLNVRFDIYSGKLKQYDSNWAYRPAANVRKGDKGGNCNKYTPDDPTKSMPLPPGNNYDSTKGMTDSTWDRSTYWSVNHKATYPTIASKTNPTGNTSAPASRYDVYRYEIDNGLVGDKSKGNETGIPQCFNKGKSPTPTDVPDRRLVNMAIVDCIANQSKINGHTQLKPDGYASVFLISPVEKQNSKDDDDETGNEKPISLEIVDVDGPLGNGTLDKALRNEAQLYR